MPSKDLSQQGQVFFIVVLVMVVALTVGLSVASRTITNLRISSDEISSQKAFNAAEAGIEQALKNGEAITTAKSIDSFSQIKQVSVDPVIGNSFLVNAGVPVFQNDGADIWLSSYSIDSTKIYQNQWSGNLTIYWGTSTESCSPGINAAALEIIVISGQRYSPYLAKYALDPCSTRAASNQFAAPNGSGGTVSGKNFKFSHTFFVSKGFIARIIPLYLQTPIAVIGDASNGANLPSQGTFITSTGVSGLTTRKIGYFQGYESLPSEFFYSLFAPK